MSNPHQRGKIIYKDVPIFTTRKKEQPIKPDYNMEALIEERRVRNIKYWRDFFFVFGLTAVLISVFNSCSCSVTMEQPTIQTNQVTK